MISLVQNSQEITKFIGKHLCQSLFFNKVAGLTHATLSKNRLWHRCFPWEVCEISKKTFLQNTSRRLLLKKVSNDNHHTKVRRNNSSFSFGFGSSHIFKLCHVVQRVAVISICSIVAATLNLLKNANKKEKLQNCFRILRFL